MSDRIPDDELAGGLNAACESEAHAASVLKALDAQPLHLPGSEPVPAGDATGRYQLVGEIARGGMGVIYKGRDVDLGRDVAMKVLRTSYKDNPQATERFMEEAQIGGQLQHPGIVPVYELGLDGEGQPYFSMKLVKGKTLAALLKEGETSRRRLLTIFEQVCQTMAYAHARGVVHRDLKPANIMVGAFGEVQVVDWGFAKVLGQGGIADERPRPDVSVIATVRSSGEGSDSIAGSVMGTPAYMPPEQALGQVEALDERSDVFALGAILCELLTGAPIYAKHGGDNLIVQAARCDLTAAFGRLEDEDLEPLLRACLASNQADRPKDAAYVADAIVEHLANVDDRAHEAELEAARARVHADGERRKRKLTMILAGAVLGAVVLAGLTWWGLDAKEQERAQQARVNARAAHEEALVLLGQDKHDEALEAVARSLHHAPTNAAQQLERRIHNERESQARAVERARMDAALLAELTQIRSTVGEARDPGPFDERLTRAFDQYGTSPTDAGSLRDRGEMVRVAIASALAEWAIVRRDALKLALPKWLSLLETAGMIDPDPLRTEVRNAFRDGTRDKLKQLAGTEDLVDLPAATLDLLALMLRAAEMPAEAVNLLQRAHRYHPGDYFVNLHLGWLHPDDTIGARYLAAAAAVRPEVEAARTLLAQRLDR